MHFLKIMASAGAVGMFSTVSLQVIKDQALDSAERTDDGMETTDGSQQPIEQNQLQTLELHNMDLQVAYCDNSTYWF